MHRIASRAFSRLASPALVLLAAVFLASCGSGAVSNDNATPANTGPLSITPSTATVYSDLPTTFVVSGGSGSYVVVSSDQNVVPVASSLKGGGFTVVPGDVSADTTVTITLRDATDASAAPATATLTVKPRTVSNVVTVTPSASQSAACGTAVCSGGDAVVSVKLAQAGVTLVSRQVRFDVVSGDIRIITSAPGAPEDDELSGFATTDSTGTASIRVRILADATSQTALLQITDLASGATQRTSVSIAPSSNAPLNAQPSTIAFQGTTAGTCASNIAADVIVFGGRPPYLISQPGSFGVNPTVVTNSGGRFTVSANGQCSAGSAIAVVDGNGASVTVTASNKLSDLPVATPTPTTPPFSASSATATLNGCNSIANITLSGGSGSYFGTTNNTAIAVTVNSNIGSIQIQSGTQAADIPPTAKVTFSDGQSHSDVTVTITGVPATGC